MSSPNFTTTLLVDQTLKEAFAEEAFDAFNNVRGWWSEEIEGGTDKLGDEFKCHFKDWPAPGLDDTKFGVTMGPEVRHGAAEVYARVQA